MSRLFRALNSRNYRLFFGGELISMMGSWMQAIVQAWLVYRLSHSALWLGVIAFCSQFSAFMVSPFAGVLADRMDRRRLLIWVEIAGMAQALCLAALFFTGKIELWHIGLLSVVLGVCNSFEIITRHSFAIDLVGKPDLPSAISLNSIVINGSRIAGPALAGILIGFINEGWCFLLNAVSYLAVLLSLAAMNLTRRQSTHSDTQTAFTSHFGAAIQYVRNVPQITRLMGLSICVSFLGFPVGNLMPVFAKDVLHGEATTLAWLTGVTGIGAISGAIFLSAWHSRPARGGDGAAVRGVLTVCVICMGISLMGLGLSRSLIYSLAACVALGFFMMGAMPLINTRIQQLVDDPMRGRVLSLYTMTFLGATPLGSLLQGWAADRYGAGAVSTSAGAAFVALGGALLVDADRGRRRRKNAQPSAQKVPQNNDAVSSPLG